MDSLIVLRKPLKKSQLTPKFSIPRKTKRAAPKLLAPGPEGSAGCDPGPTRPPTSESGQAGPPDCEPGQAGPAEYEPPICFVQLYREACLETSRSDRPKLRLASPVPTRLHFNSPESQSTESLVTQYKGYSGGDMTMNHQVFCDIPPSSTARADFVLELDYGTSFNDSRTS